MNAHEVARLLANVYDPELGIDLVALGLVYNIQVNGNVIDIALTTTSADCPMGGAILEAAEQFVASRLPGFEIRVNPAFEPPWDVNMVDDQARAWLGIPPGVKASA